MGIKIQILFLANELFNQTHSVGIDLIEHNITIVRLSYPRYSDLSWWKGSPDKNLTLSIPQPRVNRRNPKVVRNSTLTQLTTSPMDQWVTLTNPKFNRAPHHLILLLRSRLRRITHLQVGPLQIKGTKTDC